MADVKTTSTVYNESDWKKRLEALKNEQKRTAEQEREYQILKSKFSREQFEKEKEYQRELHQIELENIQAEGTEKDKVLAALKEKYGEDENGNSKLLGSVVNAVSNAVDSIESQLDATINDYISKQQQMSAHLVGTGVNLTTLTDSLMGILSGNSLVKQETVYNKLNELLSAGITYNVEQRAFLSTIADDIDLVFNDTNGSLSRLIRLQNADLSANRLAIEYSLQKFLNQNYETSEYIKDAYSSVSDALIESQSLMSASGATAYETMVQTWLGSYYSNGMSSGTVTSLAEAIDKLGSGNIEGLGSGISNLIVMGAAKAGLDFGEMLTNGINAEDVNSLMVGITSYLTEMGSNSSNVVKSQLSSIFGVNVSDLVAAQNYAGKSASGTVSSDINELFGDYNDLVSYATKMNNIFSNMMYGWGINIANDTDSYVTYKLTQLIGNLGESIFGGIAPGGIDIGQVIKLGSFGLGTLMPLFESLTTSTNLYNGTSTSLLGSIYNALAGGTTVSGTTVKVSNEGVSGSMYVNTSDTDSILSSSINSLNQTGAVETVTGTEEEIDYEELTYSRLDDIHNTIKDIYTTIGDIYIKIGNN